MYLTRELSQDGISLGDDLGENFYVFLDVIDLGTRVGGLGLLLLLGKLQCEGMDLFQRLLAQLGGGWVVTAVQLQVWILSTSDRMLVECSLDFDFCYTAIWNDTWAAFRSTKTLFIIISLGIQSDFWRSKLVFSRVHLRLGWDRSSALFSRRTQLSDLYLASVLTGIPWPQFLGWLSCRMIWYSSWSLGASLLHLLLLCTFLGLIEHDWVLTWIFFDLLRSFWVWLLDLTILVFFKDILFLRDLLPLSRNLLHLSLTQELGIFDELVAKLRTFLAEDQGIPMLVKLTHYSTDLEMELALVT